MSLGFTYPIFGPTIACPHCRQPIEALTLTDSYLCHRHGAFESDPNTRDLVHLQSGRRWRMWQDQWFRQHTHADGIRFEIHEEIDRLRTQGLKATHIIIAKRYTELLGPYLEHAPFRRPHDHTPPRLYGLPVTFSQGLSEDPVNPSSSATLQAVPARSPQAPSRWDVINFELIQEADPAYKRSFPRLTRP